MQDKIDKAWIEDSFFKGMIGGSHIRSLGYFLKEGFYPLYPIYLQLESDYRTVSLRPEEIKRTAVIDDDGKEVIEIVADRVLPIRVIVGFDVVEVVTADVGKAFTTNSSYKLSVDLEEVFVESHGDGEELVFNLLSNWAAETIDLMIVDALERDNDNISHAKEITEYTLKEAVRSFRDPPIIYPAFGKQAKLDLKGGCYILLLHPYTPCDIDFVDLPDISHPSLLGGVKMDNDIFVAVYRPAIPYVSKKDGWINNLLFGAASVGMGVYPNSGNVWKWCERKDHGGFAVLGEIGAKRVSDRHCRIIKTRA